MQDRRDPSRITHSLEQPHLETGVDREDVVALNRVLLEQFMASCPQPPEEMVKQMPSRRISYPRFFDIAGI